MSAPRPPAPPDVAALRARIQGLLEANTALKDERTEARAIAIALEVELEALRLAYGRLELANRALHARLEPVGD